MSEPSEPLIVEVIATSPPVLVETVVAEAPLEVVLGVPGPPGPPGPSANDDFDLDLTLIYQTAKL